MDKAARVPLRPGDAPLRRGAAGDVQGAGQTGQAGADLDNSSLERVDKITFRTPDYQLSTVQDYRKGRPGSQQHIWQATLGPDTAVFTINPGGTPQVLAGPSAPQRPAPQRAGGGLRRARGAPARTEDHRSRPTPPATPCPRPRRPRRRCCPRTLAVFRRADVRPGGAEGRLDVRTPGARATWRCGRAASPRWSNDVFGGEGLVAEGRKNVWVCQLGREKVDGPFAAWADKVAAAATQLDRFIGEVRGARRGRGQLRLGGPTEGGRPGASRCPTTPASTTPTPRCPGARAATRSATPARRC